jgi:hypothetical protein
LIFFLVTDVPLVEDGRDTSKSIRDNSRNGFIELYPDNLKLEAAFFNFWNYVICSAPRIDPASDDQKLVEK